MLGVNYYYGEGVSQDIAHAIFWFSKAATQNKVEAQLALGEYYYHGDQDYEEAVHWYRKAAEQGNSRAQFYLGSCYDNGKGVPKDKQEAIYWYRKAAEQGNFCSQAALDRLQGKWYRLIKELSE